MRTWRGRGEDVMRTWWGSDEDVTRTWWGRDDDVKSRIISTKRKFRKLTRIYRGHRAYVVLGDTVIIENTPSLWSCKKLTTKFREIVRERVREGESSLETCWFTENSLVTCWLTYQRTYWLQSADAEFDSNWTRGQNSQFIRFAFIVFWEGF